MIKYLLIPLVLFFITGCENCDDEVNNLLSDFEKGLIPFNIATTKNFLNQNSETVTGTYSKKENKITDLDFGNDEDCNATNVESDFSFLTFSGLNLTIEIYVNKNRNNKTMFSLTSITNNNVVHAMENCNEVVENIQGSLTNVEIAGFQFTDVYVFNSCSQNSTINRILYSATNGVEFIEYDNGDYLKLDI